MAASSVYISHRFLSSEGETVHRHKALLKCFQAALETAEKQPSSHSLGMSLGYRELCWLLCPTGITGGGAEKDRSALTPGGFLSPK